VRRVLRAGERFALGSVRFDGCRGNDAASQRLGSLSPCLKPIDFPMKKPKPKATAYETSNGSASSSSSGTPMFMGPDGNPPCRCEESTGVA